MNVSFCSWRSVRSLYAALLAATLSTGCSVRQLAMNKVADALAASGSTFASDDDPELVREAVPFSLKLMESVLSERPRHTGLLLAATSGFTQYAYAFVQQECDERRDTDFEASEALRSRAKRLYLRARDYGLRGLDACHPGCSNGLRRVPREEVRRLEKRDMPLLFWTAASWAAAISVSKDDPTLISDQSNVEALLDRALELDEAFDDGTLRSLMISYEMARQGRAGDSANRAREHFLRAVELSGGRQAGPFVSFAEAVCVEMGNRREFESLLRQALALDVNAQPMHRLANLVAQRRARWLLSRADDLFLETK